VDGRRIHITGIVQGVGFRPYVHLLAERLGLTGWIRNSSSGVEIEIEGPPAALTAFEQDLRGGGPPRAHIEQMTVESAGPWGHEGFEIVESRAEAGEYLPVSPDIGICADCRREMSDPDDRRFRYPFINCTNCGPRFTIIRDIPYDRPQTTMAGFALCPDCAAEYGEPRDRRYHAQPVACPVCGPQVRLERGGTGEGDVGERLAERETAIARTRALLAAGGIAAVKGLGGFHLACDATSAEAVAELRRRKQRDDKPFALMAADLATIEKYVEVSAEDRALLESPENPIVLMPRRPEEQAGVDTGTDSPPLAPDVAPGLNRLGFMLPYTPLHHLLLEPEPGYPPVLVMTSGNLSDEPIAYDDEDARSRLADYADAFLMHDRPIHMRCDDSVVADFRGGPCFFRRSRGYAPFPILLPVATPHLLATGGEYKNTFCCVRDERAFVSHFIGEMASLEANRSFGRAVAHYEKLFRIEPELIVHDAHPDYQATRYAEWRAQDQGLKTLSVQHHHAHIASVMADNALGLERRVIGVAFDGTGYGTDTAIWGGEFLIAGYDTFVRAFHLVYTPLPGGDAAILNPCRVALGWLRQAGLEWSEDFEPVRNTDEEERNVLAAMFENNINTLPTSSMGRLFDAAASLAGVRQRIAYEAQAACEFEALADRDAEGAYRFAIHSGSTPTARFGLIDPTGAIAELAADARAGTGPGTMAMRFHRGIAAMVVEVCGILRSETGLEEVALSGGVWQNMLLLELTVALLEERGFTIRVHRRVPANDGGLSLGQAAAAAALLAARTG